MRRVLTASDLDEFRSRVCLVATDLIAELGYDGFNMRILAARLGVSAMTAYRYFDSKTEILAAVRARGFDALADRLESVGELADSIPERFVAVCGAYVAFAREEPIRYRLMFELSQSEAVRKAELAGADRRAYEALARHARAFGRAGFNGAGLERFARLLWASLHGIVALTLMDAYPECDLDDLLHETILRLAGSCGCRLDAGEALVHATRERVADRMEPLNGAHRQAPAVPLTLAE